MAANFYGGSFLSCYVDGLLVNLSSILEQDGSVQERKDLLVRLQNYLNDVGSVLDDAEHKQFTDKRVKKWLVDLQDALYFADDFLDELTTKAAMAFTQKDPGNSSSWSHLVDSYIEDSGDLLHIVRVIESVVARKNYLNLKESAKVDMSWRIPSTHLVEKWDICGREEDKEAIVKLLLDTGDGDISVIPIVGMGGIGKTTLAQCVYRDDKVKENFDFQAWVCVSEEFDIVKVTKVIIQAITSSSCNLTDLNLLQHDLKERLSGQKFFIVFDDVWHENYDDWNELLKPFQEGVKGSKILITTRSISVASVVQTVPPHQLSLLSDEDCWLVFSKQARLSTVSVENPTLEKIGRHIVKMCRGLPLAAQALGGLLRGNSDVKYWNHLLESEIWELRYNRIIFIPALMISYYYLPSYLKKCFIYCSLYPKDYGFSKDELIFLWMAEDCLQPGRERTMEEVGDEYFDELVARSFFQPHSTCEKIFVMHDLVHDLAILFAGEFYFRAEELRNAHEVDIKTRHLSYNAKDNYSMSELLRVCDEVKHTRTFLEINLESQVPCNMKNAPSLLLSQLKCLRTLSFKRFPLESLPDSIGELIHLRYLDLSETYIVTLPETFGNLYNLQTLKLFGCRNMKMLPVGIKKLVNLRHLDIRGTYLHEMLKGMNKLKSLQFLLTLETTPEPNSGFQGTSTESEIEEILHEPLMETKSVVSRFPLGSSSDTSGFPKPKETSSAMLGHQEPDSQSSMAKADIPITTQAAVIPPTNTLSKTAPFKAETFSSEEAGDQRSSFEVLKVSTVSQLKSLPPMLHTLKIEGCESLEAIPNDLLAGLTALKELYLISCGSLTSLPSLGSVTVLYIQNCRRLENLSSPESKMQLAFLQHVSIGSSCGSVTTLPLNLFCQLKSLCIWDCPNLASFHFSGEPRCDLTSLESLEIRDCPKLKSFPVEGLHAPSLVSILLSNCESLEKLPNAMDSLISLKSLFLHRCPQIKSFPPKGLPLGLVFLSIASCDKLKPQKDWGLHNLKSLSRFELEGGCIGMESFPEENLLPFNIDSLSISMLKHLKKLDNKGFRHLNSLQSLEIYCCKMLQSLPDEGFPSSLEHLCVQECSLLTPRLKSLTGAELHKMAHIQHIQIDGQVLY